jgi:hypothetical protein
MVEDLELNTFLDPGSGRSPSLPVSIGRTNLEMDCVLVVGGGRRSQPTHIRLFFVFIVINIIIIVHDLDD